MERGQGGGKFLGGDRMGCGTARYYLISTTPEYVLINDLGGRPGGGNCKTITNAAAWVVKDLFDRGLIADGQRLYYRDTRDQIDEILIRDRRFAGFKHGGRPEDRVKEIKYGKEAEGQVEK